MLAFVTNALKNLKQCGPKQPWGRSSPLANTLKFSSVRQPIQPLTIARKNRFKRRLDIE